jgi:hypothetical protein
MSGRDHIEPPLPAHDLRVLRETLERKMTLSNPAEYQLTKGQALVIAGPQGSGKTTLARQIAAKNGTYAQICANDLIGGFGLGNALADEPDTLIVDEVPAHKLADATLKKMLTDGMIECNQKYKPLRTVKTPHLIFCINEEQLLAFSKQFRSFRVERVG